MFVLRRLNDIIGKFKTLDDAQQYAERVYGDKMEWHHVQALSVWTSKMYVWEIRKEDE